MTGRSRRWLLATLVACRTEAPETPPQDPRAMEEKATALVEEAAPRPEAIVAPDPTAEPVEIVLVWQGIGALHKSFFSDETAVRRLGADLAGRVAGPANVYVRHDNEEFVGQIHLQLRPDTRLVDVHHEGDLIRLQDLAPVTAALARYRSDVAGRFDFRVESFHVGIESFRGADTCVFGVAGTPPPDGRVVSPCVLIGGEQVCGEPEAAGARFPSAAARTIRHCLDL